MTEDQLRTEYWEDNRTNPLFPIWLVFRAIGHEDGQCDGVPYTRKSRREVPSILKTLETSPLVSQLAKELGIEESELRATLWYAAWELEHIKPRAAWQAWNQRVDQAPSDDRRES